MHDETPINGNENDKIFSERAALTSFIQSAAMTSEKKKTTAVERAATHKVSITDRAKIRFTDRAVPQVSSSAISRVTAVEIPLVANVDASIYTDKMRV